MAAARADGAGGRGGAEATSVLDLLDSRLRSFLLTPGADRDDLARAKTIILEGLDAHLTVDVCPVGYNLRDIAPVAQFTACYFSGTSETLRSSVRSAPALETLRATVRSLEVLTANYGATWHVALRAFAWAMSLTESGRAERVEKQQRHDIAKALGCVVYRVTAEPVAPVREKKFETVDVSDFDLKLIRSICHNNCWMNTENKRAFFSYVAQYIMQFNGREGNFNTLNIPRDSTINYEIIALYCFSDAMLNT